MMLLLLQSFTIMIISAPRSSSSIISYAPTVLRHRSCSSRLTQPQARVLRPCNVHRPLGQRARSSRSVTHRRRVALLHALLCNHSHCLTRPAPLVHHLAFHRRAGGEHPEIIYADIDPSQLHRVRSAMPVIDHERPAAYSVPSAAC